MKAKKYFLSMVAVYMAYLTHGMQALIFSQNQINFATKWGFDMSDPTSTAYAAGAAAVSTAIAWTGLGKFLSVWIGGEISDRVGRKKLMIGGAALYIVCFLTMLTTSNATLAAFAGLMAGVATSGFWDASGYPAVQEAYPAAPGTALIMIKFFVAASSIFYPLICVATLAIFNRDDEFYAKAETTKEKLAKECPDCAVSVTKLEESDKLAEAIKACDILVNATSVGMKPQDGISLVDTALLRKDLVVSDTVYNPEKTQLILDAEAAGCAKAIGGKGMLLWQGAVNYKLYTGKDMPVEEYQKFQAEQAK